MMEEGTEAVRQANDAFYLAFEKRDVAQMEALWRPDDNIICIHPGWLPRMGQKQVRDGWEAIFNHVTRVAFSVCVMEITIVGDFARAVCREHIVSSHGEATTIATHLFERHDGRWLLVHRHSSPLLTDADPAADNALPMLQGSP